MSEWKPIETAPKDGTFVLLYSPDAKEPSIFVGYFISHVDGDEWFSEWHDAWVDDGAKVISDVTLTHWMPLPERPEPLTATRIANCNIAPAP